MMSDMLLLAAQPDLSESKFRVNLDTLSLVHASPHIFQSGMVLYVNTCRASC